MAAWVNLALVDSTCVDVLGYAVVAAVDVLGAALIETQTGQ